MAKAVSTTSPPPRRALLSAPALGAAAVLLVFALGVAFALGRWSADPPSPPERAEAAPRAAAEPAPSFEVAPRRAPPVVRAVPPSVVAPPVPPSATGPEEPVARATEEVKTQIETLRPYIISHCLPSGMLAGGRASATLTINSTFDSQGREIARGVSEDRRAPAGELASCLRQLQGMALSISPPGANVGVRVPVAFP